MSQEASDLKRIAGISAGVMTFLSMTTMPYGMSDVNSFTSNNNYPFSYESPVFVNDNQGELCISSPMTNLVRGNIMTVTQDVSEYVSTHTKRIVYLQVTKVSKHKSNFEFEEEYEEI